MFLIMLANRSSEDTAELKYLGITLEKQNCSHVSRLCIGNTCAIQFSIFVTDKTVIKIHIFCTVLYECITLPLT